MTNALDKCWMLIIGEIIIIPPQKSHWDFVSLSPPPSISPSLSQTTLSYSRGRKPPYCKQIYKDAHVTRKRSLSSSGPQELRSASKHERCENISFSPSAPSHTDGLRQYLDQSLLRSPESESAHQATPRIWPAETACSTARLLFQTATFEVSLLCSNR